MAIAAACPLGNKHLASVNADTAPPDINHHRSWGNDPDEDVWRPAAGGRKKVNGVVAWLKDAGLVKLGPAVGPSMYAAKPWQLTAAAEDYLSTYDTAVD